MSACMLLTCSPFKPSVLFSVACMFKRSCCICMAHAHTVCVPSAERSELHTNFGSTTLLSLKTDVYRLHVAFICCHHLQCVSPHLPAMPGHPSPALQPVLASRLARSVWVSARRAGSLQPPATLQ